MPDDALKAARIWLENQWDRWPLVAPEGSTINSLAALITRERQDAEDVAVRKCAELVKGYAHANSYQSQYDGDIQVIYHADDEIRQAFPRAFEAQSCPDCIEATKLAYSDTTTPGFYYDKCEKHRTK